MALRSLSDVDVAWLAGLFEGEATFGYAGTRRGVKAVRITLAMSDRDVVQRAYELVGSGSFNPDRVKFSKKFPNAKPMYEFSMGSQKDCQDLMLLLLPHMGTRRSLRLMELIMHIDVNPSTWNRGEGGKHGGTRRASRGCVCGACATERDRIKQRKLDYYYRTKEEKNAKD